MWSIVVRDTSHRGKHLNLVSGSPASWKRGDPSAMRSRASQLMAVPRVAAVIASTILTIRLALRRLRSRRNSVMSAYGCEADLARALPVGSLFFSLLCDRLARSTGLQKRPFGSMWAPSTFGRTIGPFRLLSELGARSEPSKHRENRAAGCLIQAA
jgi:hypothetical protein